MKNKPTLTALGPEIPRQMPDAPATGFTAWREAGALRRQSPAGDSALFIFTCKNEFIGRDVELLMELSPGGTVLSAQLHYQLGGKRRPEEFRVALPPREVSGMLLDLAQTRLWEGTDLSNGLGELIAVCNAMRAGGRG